MRSLWTYNGGMPLEINRPVPDFELVALNGQTLRLSDSRGRITVVNFWSADCPHVERTDAAMQSALARWGANVVLLNIAPNANETDSQLENAARSRGPLTVLKDAGHVVADTFEALITPEVFIVDREGILRYRGAVDDVSFRQRAPTRSYFEDAVESLLAGGLPATAEAPAFGCAIVRAV